MNWSWPGCTELSCTINPSWPCHTILNSAVQWTGLDLDVPYAVLYWTIKRTGCIELLCCTATWLYCTTVLYYDLAVLGVAVVVEDDRWRRRVIVQLNTINQVINNLRQPSLPSLPWVVNNTCALFYVVKASENDVKQTEKTEMKHTQFEPYNETLSAKLCTIDFELSVCMYYISSSFCHINPFFDIEKGYGLCLCRHALIAHVHAFSITNQS